MFIGSQTTSDALDAMDEANRLGHDLVCAPFVPAEFLSILRAAVTRGQLEQRFADRIFELFLGLPFRHLENSPVVIQRGWWLASHINSGDVFDSMGLAAAESADAEFWTSDARFANAVASAKLPGVRFIR